MGELVQLTMIIIFGFGRFGRTFARMYEKLGKRTLAYDPYVSVRDLQKSLPDNLTAELLDKVKIFNNKTELKQEIYAELSRERNGTYSDLVYVFFAVPIAKFPYVFIKNKSFLISLQKKLKNLNKKLVVMDVLSVKQMPAKIITKAVKADKRLKAIHFILTHPMFGPDSSKHGFSGLPIVVHNLSADKKVYKKVLSEFKDLGLQIRELTPAMHDKLAANSQGVAHFVGRMLAEFGFKPTPIDTLGAQKLYEIMSQTINDSWQLFENLQQYNPYTKQMRIKLGKAYVKIYNKLLPKQVNPNYVTIGIQGGKGSFNQIAAEKFVKMKNIQNYKLKYLYTSERVLRSLTRGGIDIGIFAVHNAQGGIVWESARALAKYKVSIISEFYIPIAHHLMILPNVEFKEITTIMAHPQVFKQCKKTLNKKYPKLKQVVGKNDLIDTAKAAEALAKGKLPKTTAVLGPIALSTIYNLKVVDENLQDLKNNKIWFFAVKR